MYLYSTPDAEHRGILSIKDVVVDICDDINNLNVKINQILIDRLNLNFRIDDFFDSLKDKSTFCELNPRIIFEQKQIDDKIKIEEQKKIKDEKKLKDEKNRIEVLKNARKTQRNILKEMYYNGPENIYLVKIFIKHGYDISDSIYPISRMIDRGRSIEFIQFLIENGLILRDIDIETFKRVGFLNSKEFLNVVYSSKSIDNDTVNQIIELK